MVVASFVVAALLQVALPTSANGDTVPATNIELRATTAPADSASVVARHRRETSMDARLVPDWNRSAVADTNPRRRKAVEYSDEYYSRLQMHRVGSWLEFPIFGAEYWLGQKLISRTETPADWVKTTHAVVAGTLGGLFAINTITGVWNLYESRKETDQRALVWTHSALMLASDAGFLITAMLAGDAEDSFHAQDRHRNAALVSMSIAGAGTLIMWLKRGL
ncbi:MAG TPA: hypothetical protein VGQ56_17270 [Gemmatimonadaceae bacterium]|jgi:hypothetical protein|nr:hypothetical protein [Gemmatimonadaceae bacterium]